MAFQSWTRTNPWSIAGNAASFALSSQNLADFAALAADVSGTRHAVYAGRTLSEGDRHERPILISPAANVACGCTDRTGGGGDDGTRSGPGTHCRSPRGCA